MVNGSMTPQDTESDDTQKGPLVSVVMSNFNGSVYLEAAVASVLNQSHAALELILVDDASTDDSGTLIDRLAAQDERVRPILLRQNRGPAGARNVALDAARGDWMAIIDADDLIHPQRIERLLATAKQMGADAIADDLLSFGSADVAGQTLLDQTQAQKVQELTAADLIRSDTVGTGMASLGYLKPLIRKETLASLRYDETLRIGEDFDLYCRLLLAGARFALTPDPTYLYRRHAGSVSHRLSTPSLNRLITAHDALAEQAYKVRPEDRELQQQLGLRKQRLNRALRYQRLVNRVKAKGILTAWRPLWRHPYLLGDVLVSLKDRWRRMMSSARPNGSGRAVSVVLASKDRLQQVSAPPNALRIPAPDTSTPEADRWAERRVMACTLAKLASSGSIDVIAEGPAGLDALGYLPTWRSTRLALEKQDCETRLIPRDVVLDHS